MKLGSRTPNSRSTPKRPRQSSTMAWLWPQLEVWMWGRLTRSSGPSASGSALPSGDRHTRGLLNHSSRHSRGEMVGAGEPDHQIQLPFSSSRS